MDENYIAMIGEMRECWAVTRDYLTFTLLKKKPGCIRRFWYWFSGQDIVVVRFPEGEL